MPLPLSICTVLIGAVLFLSPLLASSHDEPAWNAFFIAAIALATAIQLWQARPARASSYTAGTRGPTVFFFAAAALGLASLVWHWIGVSHGRPVYLDIMGQGWAYLAALAGLAWAMSHIGENRAARYILLLCLAGSAGIAGVYGVQDWLIHAKEHAADWREFSFTTDPDFFAGFLVITIPLTLALYLGAPAGNARSWGIIRLVVLLLIAYALVLPFLYGLLAVVGIGGAATAVLMLVMLVGVVALLIRFSVAPMLLGLSLIWQLAALVTTGSRFALVTLVVSFAVVGLAYGLARRAGMPAAPAFKGRILILVALAVVGGAVVARPVLHRLSSGTLESQAHSGNFRLWTWKGAARMASANPVLGTGPGTFVYTYPRYALAGFTQLAHDSYIQIADDIGIPALALVIAGFIGVIVFGFRAVGQDVPAPPAEEPEPALAASAATSSKSRKNRAQAPPQPIAMSQADVFLSQIGMPDDRLLLAGLLGAFIAGLVQNLIDSDLYLLYNGVALFAIAGAILALSLRPARRWLVPTSVLAAGSVVYLAVFLGMAWCGVASFYALSGDYRTAASMVPWSAEYAGDLGWLTYPAEGLPLSAGQALQQAANLAPDVKSENRLGQFYLQQGQPNKAMAAFQDGLRSNPNDLELLLSAAQTAAKLGNPGAALAYYRRMVALQHGPVGMVPAVPEAVQYRYAIADSAVADSEMAQGDLAGAARDYQAAQGVLESYANGDGSRSPYQEIGNGGQPNPTLDQSLQALYEHVTAELQQIDQRTGKPGDAAALQQRAARFTAKFAGIIAGK